MRLEIVNKAGQLKKSKDTRHECFPLIAEGETSAYLSVQETPFSEGDILRLSVDTPKQFVWLKMHVSLESSLVYLAEKPWGYPLYFNEQAVAAQVLGCFQGTVHYLSAQLATEAEINRYQNLALNPHDHKSATGGYLHTFANVETRNDAPFFACNAIDGVLANHFHGLYPYKSWKINQQADVALTIDFGREVELDSVTFTLWAYFSHDSYWQQVSFGFLDGTKGIFTTKETIVTQSFTFSKRAVTAVVFVNLIKDKDASKFPTLMQIELFGKNKQVLKSA